MRQRKGQPRGSLAAQVLGIVERTMESSGDLYSRAVIIAMAQDCGSRMDVARAVDELIAAGALTSMGFGPGDEPLYGQL